MSKQKISGILHNCSLYCTLPTLLDGINTLAHLEQSNGIDTIKKNPVVASYCLLKDLFAEYYEVDPKALTFTQWSDFLEQYSFYAKELIFSPVLRLFVQQKAIEENYENPLHFSSLQTKGYCAGHYNDLAYGEAHDLFYRHFGILHVQNTFKGQKNTKNPQDNYKIYDPQFIKSENYPFAEQPTINLYHKNGHYELHPHESLLHETRIYEKEAKNLPNFLLDAHQKISVSVRAFATQLALNVIKEEIHEELDMSIAISESLSENNTKSIPNSISFNTDNEKKELVTEDKTDFDIQEAIQPIKDKPINTLMHEDQHYNIRRMAEMVSQFTYNDQNNENSFMNARKSGDSPEAKAKSGRFFSPRRSRHNEIKALREAAQKLSQLYTENADNRDIEEAGNALIALVLKTENKLSTEWNRKKSNLWTNLEQVLEISKAGKNVGEIVKSLQKNQSSIHSQLMFKAVLQKVINEEMLVEDLNDLQNKN